jgi:hypothetical protein
MKTQLINNQHLKEECENSGEYLFSSSALLSRPSQLARVHMVKQTWSACLGWIAGLTNSIKVASKEVVTNDRLFWGVVLMFGLAPTSWLAPYLSIFSDSVIEGWYYKKIAFYLYTVRFNLVLIFAFTGAFIAAPLKWNYKYGCVVVVALALASLINDSFFVDDYTDFYKLRLILFIPLVAVILFALYKFMNYAVYRKYHTKDGNIARVFGMIKAPGISAEEKIKHLVKLVDESENYNNRI